MVHIVAESHPGSGEHMGWGKTGVRRDILKRTKLTPKGGEKLSTAGRVGWKAIAGGLTERTQEGGDVLWG